MTGRRFSTRNDLARNSLSAARLFLDAIARQEGIEVTEEEIDSEFQKLAEGTNKSAAALRAQLEKEERIQSFRAAFAPEQGA